MSEKKQKYFTILTEVGSQLAAKALAESKTVKLTAIAVGDGGGEIPEPSGKETALKNETHRRAIDRYQLDITDKSIVWINCIVPADVGGWWIREFGVYAEPLDGGEPVLFSYGNHAPYYKMKAESGQATTHEISIPVHIFPTAAGKSTINIIVPQSGYATQEELIDIAGKMDNRLSAVETKNTEQDNRLSAVETKNTQQDNRLSAVETKNTQQDNRLSEAEAKNTQQDNRLSEAEAKNTQQDNRLSEAEAKNTQQDNRLSEAEAKNTQQDNRLNAVEARVKQLSDLYNEGHGQMDCPHHNDRSHHRSVSLLSVDEQMEKNTSEDLNKHTIEQNKSESLIEPLSNEEQRRRIIAVKLRGIDYKSMRPLRAILAGTGTDFDKQKIKELEEESAKLRTELAKLK